MLVACFGVDALLKKLVVSFPASVACLVLLFVGLLLSEVVLGGHKTRRIVAVIDVPASVSLSCCGYQCTVLEVLLTVHVPA
jgi:hypothetical protein